MKLNLPEVDIDIMNCDIDILPDIISTILSSKNNQKILVLLSKFNYSKNFPKLAIPTHNHVFALAFNALGY